MRRSGDASRAAGRDRDGDFLAWISSLNRDHESIVEQLRERTAQLASAHAFHQRRIGEYEAAQQLLISENARLRLKLSEEHAPEGVLQEIEPGLAERIRRAIEEDRLALHCQPILDLNTNEISQYELLLRLPDEQGGKLLLPGAFLHWAERSGLIQAIDAWVVRQAIGLIASHQRSGLKLVLNVNLSGKSIGDEKLVETTEAALAESGIDPSRLMFELTEKTAISNIEEARVFAIRLEGLGCRFALDDFGAGFGSFYYLKHVPFEYLKIDGGLVRGLTTSPINEYVISAIVDIARGMGKKTVAEFVGDEDSARLLRKLGVDFAQGYHIGMPRPVSEVLLLAGANPD